MRSGKRLKVNISVAKVRLFVGNIPKQKSKEQIKAEFSKLTGDRFVEKLYFVLGKNLSFVICGTVGTSV